jgi:hypothetical protein
VGAKMAGAHRRVVAVSTVLLIIFAVGVFFLVRFATSFPSNGDVLPITSSPAGTPSVGDSSPGTTASSQTENNHENSTPPDDSNTGTFDTGAQPPPPGRGDDSSLRDGSDTRTSEVGTEPPRPATRLSSVGGVGPRIYLGDSGKLRGWWELTDPFSVQVRLVDINLSQSGNELVLEVPADEDVRNCALPTVEPGQTGRLCSVVVSVSESAEAGRYEGRLELVLEATCTTKTGRPCQNLPENYAPSPNDPINVTWSEYFPVCVAKDLDDSEPRCYEDYGSASPTAEPSPSTAEPTP